MPRRLAALLHALALLPAALAANPNNNAFQLRRPDPLPPAEAVASLLAPPGFTVQLVAAEPLTESPVAIDWDTQGRLWVVEMADYPMGMDGRMTPGGRVRILEDLDHDGVYDKSTLFASNLNFPNGLITWNHGIIVTAAPDIVLLDDPQSSLQAGPAQILYSGFRPGNLQLRVNGLRWGLDNWLHCANGWSGGQPFSPRTQQKIDLSGHDLRIHPSTGAIEAEAGQSEFGRNRTDWGEWFGCDNSYPLFHFAIEDRYLRRNPYLTYPETKVQALLPANPPVHPRSIGQKRYHSFDQAGHFTSACATDFYRDAWLFPRSDITHAFVCEPVHNLIQHLEVSETGPSYTARRAEADGQPEFLSSSDPWFRPVMVRTGPDGALYVVDMYRFMIEHPDWLPPEGRAELEPFYRLGEQRGRIYRITPKTGPRHRVETLESNRPSRWIAALESPNGWVRDKAQQLLVQLANPDRTTIQALEKLARTSREPLGRLHALCTLDGLHQLSATLLTQALHDPHPGIRRHAIRLTEAFAKHADSKSLLDALTSLSRDPDAKVRVQLACTLGEWSQPAAGRALADLASQPSPHPALITAILSSAHPHLSTLVEALTQSPNQRNLEDSLLDPLLSLSLRTASDPLTATLLSHLTSSAPEPNTPPTARQLQSLARFMDQLQQQRLTIRDLGRKTPALAAALEPLPELGRRARTLVVNPASPEPLRTAAVTLLARDPAALSADLFTLSGLLSPETPAPTQIAAVGAIAQTTATNVPTLLTHHWATLAPDVRARIIDQLLSREPWTQDLLAFFEQGRVAPNDLDASRRSRLSQHRNPTIRTRAETLFNRASDPDRAKVINEYKPALQLTGNSESGRLHFTRLCAPCHQLDGIGRDIGPNLISVKAHPPEKLLISILDPSREAEPRYLAYSCTLRSGEELYGIIASETGGSLILKLTDGSTRNLNRTDIASLQATRRSLMPDGLESGLKPQDLADLIRYLRRQPLAGLE